LGALNDVLGNLLCNFRKPIPARLDFSVQKDRSEMSFFVGLPGVYDRVDFAA